MQFRNIADYKPTEIVELVQTQIITREEARIILGIVTTTTVTVGDK